MKGPTPSQGRIVAVLHLPPPVTGHAAVNAKMIDELKAAGLLLRAVNVSPALGSSGLRKLASRSLKTAGAIRGLVAARAAGATVLYMPSDGGPGILLNVVLALAARGLGFRIWLHHHSFAYVNRRSRLMAWLIRLGPRGMGHVALCEDMLNGLKGQYGREWRARSNHGRVLPNAFVIDDAAPGSHRGEVLTIGHLSNLTVEKGALRFIALLATLRAKGVTVRGRMAGPIGDPETEAAIRAAEREHKDWFEWLGPLYGDDKNAFLDSLDAFVFPSGYVNEAQPLVLLEALAHGAAVLTTQRGCMSCDHATSPGATAPESAFSSTAIAWLQDHLDETTRHKIPSQAKAQFRRMKSESRVALASLLAVL